MSKSKHQPCSRPDDEISGNVCENVSPSQKDKILVFLLTKCLMVDVNFANFIKDHVQSKLDESGLDRNFHNLHLIETKLK